MIVRLSKTISRRERETIDMSEKQLKRLSEKIWDLVELAAYEYEILVHYEAVEKFIAETILSGGNVDEAFHYWLVDLQVGYAEFLCTV